MIKIYEKCLKKEVSRGVVAITGGTGFIGRRLALRLHQEGYSVRILTRTLENKIGFPPGIQFYEADLTDSEARLDEFLEGVEVLYHCAGELRDETKMSIVHIKATQRLVDSAKNKIKHWVQLSSVGVYGKVFDGIVDETFPIAPCGIYEKTKAESDRIVTSYSEKGYFTLCILRPANVYGVGMPGHSLEKMINTFRKGLFFFIGKPGAIVNFIHVEDVVSALILCIKSAKNSLSIFNLSDPQTIENFAETIAKEIKKRPNWLRLPKLFVKIISYLFCVIPGFPLTPERVDILVSRACYSNDHLINEYGYCQKKTFEDGLHEYVSAEELTSEKLEALENEKQQQKDSSFKYPAEEDKQAILTPKILWVLFFCFSAFAAIIFQELLLPLIPSLHAGMGLLTKDPLTHHNLAIALMERIQAGGWSEWTIWQAGMSSGLNSSFLAILYLFFGPDPSLLIPIHASLHATGGVLIFMIGRLIWPGHAGRYGGLIASFLFIIFPSAINWYAQPLKDGYIIAGMLLILYAWLKLLIHKLEWRLFFLFLFENLLGGILIVSVKPYALQMMMVIMPLSYLVTFVFWSLRSKSQSGKKLFISILGIFIVILFAFNVKNLSSLIQQRDLAYSEELNKSSNQNIKNWSWESNDWAPKILDRYAKQLSTIRVGLTSVPEAYNAYSTIDRDLMPSSMAEMIVYLPRGLQIALWAPFPNTWFKDYSLTHLVGWSETIIWYLLMPGVFFAFCFKRSPGVMLVCLFALGFLIVYGYVTANVGTLHRLRYPYLFLLILVGTLGWVQFFIEDRFDIFRRIRKKKNHVRLQIFSESKSSTSSVNLNRVNVVNAGILVSIFTIISYLLLFLRDMMMAHQFGLGPELDGFYLAMVIPMFIVNAVSIPFSAMTVPIYQEVKVQSGKQKAQSLVSGLSFLICSLLFLLSLLLLLLEPWILSTVGWGFNAEQLTHSQDVLPFGIFLLLFSGSMVLGNSLLNAHHSFAIPILAQMIVPIIATIFLYLFSNIWGITSVAIGMCVGQVLNILVVLYFLKQEEISIFPRWDFLKLAWHSGLTLFSALVIAAIFMNGVIIVDNAIASTLKMGSVGAYGLGSKIVLFITGVLGASIVTVMLPYFSSFFASGQIDKGKVELRFYLFLGTMISIPLGIGLFMHIEDLILFIFVGGELNSHDALIVSQVSAFGIIQLPFFTSYTLLIKYMNASKKTNMIIIVSLIGFVLNIFLDVIFVRFMGVSGLSLATSLSMFITGFVLLLSLYSVRDINIIDILQISLFWLLYLSAVICIQYNSSVGLVICGLSFLMLAFSVHGLILNSGSQKKIIC